uniref:Cathepsin L n=1 Tax=Ascaris suum TaxID=6253 RepID=F1LCH3_ASCSU
MDTVNVLFVLTILSVCFASLYTDEDNDPADSFKRYKFRVRDDSDEESSGSSYQARGYESLRGRVSLKDRHRIKYLIKQGYEQWRLFKEQHGKNYEDEETENDHMLAFLSNLEEIRKHNARYQRGESSFEMGTNHITDLPFEEYRKLNGYKPRYDDSHRNGTKFLVPFNINVSGHWDWRDHGYVTEVKNQVTSIG